MSRAVHVFILLWTWSLAPLDWSLLNGMVWLRIGSVSPTSVDIHPSRKPQSFAMPKETDDVATERLVELTARLVVVLPRGRGFRLGADGSISVYPASAARAAPSVLRSRKE